ncbi:GNAT family N-acetyltransferase [Streptomyces sp. NPDC017993]|uniref:GNAT family N-acetyltransferase n=1 Tax=Streptomyces sp. NPDC017993 TaxID=3365027 RepID=UPI0037BAEC88
MNKLPGDQPAGAGPGALGGLGDRGARGDLVGPIAAAEMDVDAWHAVLAAAHRHDRPSTPAPERATEAGRLRVPSPRSRTVAFALPAPGDSGDHAGVALLRLFDTEENAGNAFLDTLTVHPAHRGRGVGRALWAEVCAVLAAEGRTSVGTLVQRGGAGEKFAVAQGAECALPLVAYVQEVAGASEVGEVAVEEGRAGAVGGAGPAGHAVPAAPAVPTAPATPAARAGEPREPVTAPDGYRFAVWSGVVPDVHAVAHARAHDAMEDAPTGDLDEQHDPWDAERVRAAARVVLDRGGVMLTVAAVAEADGAVAGYTELVLPTPQSVRALQYDTVVIPGHRGHGLGRAVKLRMLEYLRGQWPGVREIMTTVADENRPMRAVNAALGYRPEDRMGVYQVRL